MLNKKAIITLFVIIILAIGALGTGTYLVVHNSNGLNASNVSASNSLNAQVATGAVIDDVSSAITKTEVVVNTSLALSGDKPLSEWCIKGQTYSISQDGAASSTIIDGIETFKGKEWCKGTSKTIIKVPGGYSADIEALTTYYFSYGGKEVWVISNVNGQVNEVHVVN